MIRYFLLFIIPISITFSQLHFSGFVNPSQMYGLKNGDTFNLPFRFGELEAGYSFTNSEFKIIGAAEHRWTNMTTDFEIREAYWIWYPSFGDISIGKQIHAWGYADASNPTDNINAYDYYYLFLTGIDRKIGSYSASIRYYGENWQVQGIIQTEHQPNRLVFEDDFPIQPPINPPSSAIDDIDDELEFGFRTQFSFDNSDLSISYFHGHERMLSAYTFNNSLPYLTPIQFEYRKSDILGIDMVNLFGDFIFRNEIAFFTTKSDKYHSSADISILMFNWTGKYIQYVSQVEYTGFSDILIAAQFLGNHTIEVKPTFMEDFFQGGMGTPFANIFENAFLISAAIDLFNNMLEIKPLILVNLEDKGYMTGCELNYSPIDNWILETTLNNFVGDDELGDNYIFNQLEDFSHIKIGIKYSF
ncbi:MAG: hypothetical protein HN729_02360 [Candidatus Marinimicrobia bacterium]|jgi:hypothetical protein|nr:hypothetical protein [Candidatus Neomarinimicrobiota bacterium]MBT3632826.1 hypothetical protein [Candidatus Neomarinimicrobiota bacterium]MBT3681936.1 hypothetical protein [Candidatus Neomarinimicrobiota bacterium]MBT3759035.1 hypothetical protein [Candidatus Neomarinimicrobiota bacterium]MBT3895066.1 hypothetical protein [Candidatus Neomarinimicrobiota bacterium]